ncbi:MAG: hypothetical protein M1834_009111 [Cirrosporium novae-zelandiae]|nr:MAG: hypothetical protein M1834_009111 [Cirrosporium novae-zelandiae]
MSTSVVELHNGLQVQSPPRDTTTNILSFKGIPYAAPPVGDLRWRSPRPPNPWKGVLPATSFGPLALGSAKGFPTSGHPQSEDCLKVNIWTGARRSDEKRPVMVWVHGGGFQFDGPPNPFYDGGELARRGGVVVVSFSYRMGVMGFLALEGLDGEEVRGFKSKSGNFGLQDQLAALRWVQENIVAFGGDPDNITVFGESAGAHAIGLLMASPHAHGLFHKAILQSGALWDSEHGPIATYDEARQRGKSLMEGLGVHSIAELRELPAKTVNEAALWDMEKDPGTTAFGPSVDEYILPISPATVFARGHQMRIPVIAGFNAQEAIPLFIARALPNNSAEEFRSAVSKLFSPDTTSTADSDSLLALYPATTPEEASASAMALSGDLIISQQTWEVGDLQAQLFSKDATTTLRESSPQPPVYLYHLTYTSPYSPIARHGADIPFVLGTLIPWPSFLNNNAVSTPSGDADHEFSSKVMTYWTNFAKTGNPNSNSNNESESGSPDLPNWPSYNTDLGLFLQLGEPVEPVRLPRILERYRFIRGLRDGEGVLPLRWRGSD